MQIIQVENIDGDIYFISRKMHQRVTAINEKLLFQNLKFDKRFAFLVGPKDSLENIQKKLLKYIQSYFDVEEWNAYRKAIKLVAEVNIALEEERILPWLEEFIPLANNAYVQYALNFEELFKIFSKYHDSLLQEKDIDRSSPFYKIIQDVLLDLSLYSPPRMEICKMYSTFKSIYSDVKISE